MRKQHLTLEVCHPAYPNQIGFALTDEVKRTETVWVMREALAENRHLIEQEILPNLISELDALYVPTA